MVTAANGRLGRIREYVLMTGDDPEESYQCYKVCIPDFPLLKSLRKKKTKQKISLTKNWNP